MRKFIALILVALLSVSALAACAKPQQELSANKKKEIEEAWLEESYKLTRKYYTLTWYNEDSMPERTHGARYYGTYSGYDFLYISVVPRHAEVFCDVAGLEFTTSYGGSLYAYRDGEFYSPDEPYENGLMSNEQVAEIHKLHQSYEEKIAELNKIPPALSREGREAPWAREPISDSLKRQIEAALNEFNQSDGSSFDHYSYYGTCGDRIVFRQSSPVTVLVSFEIAGYTFSSGSGFDIYVYANGKIYSLHEAYEAGLICTENIAKLAEYHANR